MFLCVTLETDYPERYQDANREEACGRCDNCARDPQTLVESPAFLTPLTKIILQTVDALRPTPKQLADSCYKSLHAETGISLHKEASLIQMVFSPTISYINAGNCVLCCAPHVNKLPNHNESWLRMETCEDVLEPPRKTASPEIGRTGQCAFSMHLSSSLSQRSFAQK